MGEQLRSGDEDVLRIDRIAQTLDPQEVERGPMDRDFSRASTGHENNSTNGKTDFRNIAGEPDSMNDDEAHHPAADRAPGGDGEHHARGPSGSARGPAGEARRREANQAGGRARTPAEGPAGEGRAAQEKRMTRAPRSAATGTGQILWLDASATECSSSWRRMRTTARSSTSNACPSSFAFMRF